MNSHSIKSARSHDGFILIKDNNDRVYKIYQEKDLDAIKIPQVPRP